MLFRSARGVIEKIGYTKSEYQFEAKSCGVFSSIHEQSGDINRGVERADPYEQGAGDQGMMFGYATNETENYMPLALDLSHSLLWELAKIRKEEPDLMPYLRPDAKSQVTIEYDDNGKPLRIDTIVVSTQHDEFIGPKGISQKEADEAMQKRIALDVKKILIPRVKAQYPAHVQALFNDNIIYHVNPTGKFVIGGPHGDTGLTGRKIIVDTYGGKGAHGGGAFSGKDPSKVDRSAAYAARHIAKNMVAAGVADEMLVQVSYAIGVAKPMNIFVNTFGRAKVNTQGSHSVPGGVLLSHGEAPHYHRRIGVSLLSSVWGQVGPPLYRRQDYSFNNFSISLCSAISSVSQPNKLIYLQYFLFLL